MTQSNSKRFVRAAWSLLFFQVIVSAGAVGVTGWAALHVQRLVYNQNSTTTATSPAVPADVATTSPATPTANTMLAAPPSDTTAAPAPAAAAAIQPCLPMQRAVRVPAEAEWCDTGLNVRQGQIIRIYVAGGTWSNAGPPAYRQNGMDAVVDGTWVEHAPLCALIGRVGDAAFLIGSQQNLISPADGHLLLAMNDVRGTYADNQGWLLVAVDAIDQPG